MVPTLTALLRTQPRVAENTPSPFGPLPMENIGYTPYYRLAEDRILVRPLSRIAYLKVPDNKCRGEG